MLRLPEYKDSVKKSVTAQLCSPGTIWRVGVKPVPSGTSACPGRPPLPPPPVSVCQRPARPARPPLERGTG